MQVQTINNNQEKSQEAPVERGYTIGDSSNSYRSDNNPKFIQPTLNNNSLEEELPDDVEPSISEETEEDLNNDFQLDKIQELGLDGSSRTIDRLQVSIFVSRLDPIF